uniref:Carboxylesterase type B domain-containing protein n=1 Tax=Trichobilharzia regenti TaxID=157069 RepID=A0AA85K8K3_TRIRE|nr:unnamed protein product [Trichobilharzia regenti]
MVVPYEAGMGKFIGFSTTINYDYTWSQWPPIKGRLVNVFLGIPYAAPPVEGQRFRMPVPAFLDTRFPWFAKRFRSACMQPPIWINRFMPGFKDINEDCLYLNIYYPNRTWEDPNTRYPVIVHIHGGSYVYGSSHMYPGLALASKGVVVVTFNYRLGPFGFLSTGDYASIGNYGLWDQLLAITWVKENIAWFHGDPEKITIMGESAGAASVGLHLISPLTRERYLFNQAIMMSGSDLSDWAFSDPMKVRTRYYAIELGRRLGCPSVQSKEVIQLQEAMYNGYLRYIYKDQYAFKQAFDESYVKQYLNIPYAEQTDAYAVVSCLRYDKKAEEINNIVRDIIPLRGAPTFVWTPVVDGTSGFFPRTPSKERTLGNFAKLPLLAGVVQDEGSLTFQFYLSRTENGNYVIGNLTDDVVKRIIGMWLIKMNVLRYNQTAEELYNRYTYWQNLDNNTARWKRAVDLMSDLLISSPLDAVVKYHANHSPPVYFYEFAYSSRNDKEATPETGIYHGIELPFLFGFPFMNKSIWSELFGEGSVLPKCASEVYDYPHDTNMSEFLLDLWTNFVKYGNPTPEKVKNINWSRFRQPEEAYLRIQLNSSIKYHYRSSDMAFWQNRFESLAEPLPASPPIYRSPLIDIRLATVILSCLLAIALISIIIIIILLIRRPNPKHFKSNIRYTTPGSEFHASFKDSFANSNIYSSITPTPITATTTTPTPSSVYPHHHQQQQQRPPSTFNYFTNKENKLQTASSLARTNDPLASLLTVNKHPPPPPIPSPQQQQYYDRRSSSSESSNGSLSLISSSSPPPPPSTSRRRQMKQKHDENKPVMKGVNECLVMNRLNQQDPQPYDPLLHTNDNNNNNNPYKPYITDV